MGRGSLLTGLVVVAVCCLPAAVCFGQNGAADPFAESAESAGVVVAASVPGALFHGQPLVEQAVNIDNALRQPVVDADYYDVPIGDVLEEFKARFEIPILIHESARDNNLDADYPITLQLTNVPLHSTLELLLEKHDCTIAIHNDVLQVVSNDAATEFMEKRIYDCSKLIERAKSKDQLATLEKLKDVLARSIDPGSWEISGGNAQVSEFAGKLVISQTLTNHLAIERLLGGLYDQLR